jgi:hypothetical protein
LISMLQSSPVNPSWHMQLYPSTLSMHREFFPHRWF